jgi:hypothetical protein
MFRNYLSLPIPVTFVTVFLLFTFILLDAAANPTTYADNASQEGEPLVPPPDEDPDSGEVGDTRSLPTQQQRTVSLAIAGGSWPAQGPGPATNGQVENISNREVVASGKRRTPPTPARTGRHKQMIKDPYPLAHWNLTLPTPTTTLWPPVSAASVVLLL